MAKLVLMSTVFALLVIPVLASREQDEKKGLRKTIRNLLIFQVIYLLALRFLWGRLI